MNKLFNLDHDRTVSLLAATLIAISTTVPRGLELSCLLILFYSLYHWKKWKLTGPGNYLPLFSVLLFAFISGITHILTDGPRALDISARYLLVLPLILLLPVIKIIPSWIFKGFVIGGILSGCASLYQYFALGYDRAFGALFIIYFANLAAVQAALSFSAFFWFRKHNSVWRLLAIVATIMGTTAMILSGTRGAWLALLSALLVAVVLIFEFFDWKKLTAVIIGAFILSILSYQFVPVVHERFSTTITELREYSSGQRSNIATSSSGVRFEIWRAAIREFQEAPLLGLGSEDKRSEFRKQLIKEGYFVSTDGSGSTHSEFFDAMAKRGIVGIVAILLLYLLPLIYFIKQYFSIQDPRSRLLCTSGAVFVTVFIISGLTERFLFHHVGAMFYGFIMPIMYSMVRSDTQLNEIATHKPCQ